MSELFSPNIVWFLIGLIFIFLEFMFPGVIIVFFGLGAWLVSLLCWFVEISVDTQIFIFIISSLVLLSSLRKWLKGVFYGNVYDKKSKKDITRDGDVIGDEALAATDFENGRGEIKYRGTNWKARSKQEIEKSSLVKIIDRDNITMIVEKIQNKEENNE